MRSRRLGILRKGPARRPVEERFWPKVDRSGGPDACWTWTGAIDSAGYGLLAVAKDGSWRQRGAHNLSLQFALGRELRPRFCALHHCDNRSCVNPIHLYEGTRADNARDAAIRHRIRFVLSEDDVRAVRASTTINRVQAEKYGVSESLIEHIRAGRRRQYVA